MNMLKSVNALRCALTSLGTNTWNLVASIYWAIVAFGQEEQVKEWLDIGYEYICTCQEDAKNIVKGLGGDMDGGRSEYIFSSCSETGAVKKGDYKAKQEESRKEQEAERQVEAREANVRRIEQSKEAEFT
jgi:hypothetical protein